MVQRGDITILGGSHEIATGIVTFFDESVVTEA
jgi:hypothetical protein